MGADPDSGSPPLFMNSKRVWRSLASCHDVDYPSRMSSAPAYGRINGSHKLHSLYLARRDLMQCHEVSKQDIIHVHKCISRFWGSQRKLATSSEPIWAQALYEFICSWVCFTIPENFFAREIIRGCSLLAVTTPR